MGGDAMKTLVTGATGTVGSEVVKALVARGADVKVLTRKQPQAGTFAEGVEIAVGDLGDPVSIRAALEGVDKLFLLIGNVNDEFTQAITAYSLAKKAGVKHITYLSVFDAERFLEVPHFAAKLAVEQAIHAGGVAYTILRPGYFMQNDGRLKPLLTGPGIYPMPIGDAGIAMVDVRDLAEAAAISLTEAGHEGKTYSVVARENISGPKAASIWSGLLGRDSKGKEIQYTGHGDFDGFEAQMRKSNENWHAYDLRVMFEGYVELGFAASAEQADALAKVIGREPRSYREFAAETVKAWA
jgi:uncharacterized protein YbjT (DUF2867 family)